MFVYGVCAGPSPKFDQIAGPGIDAVRDPEDEVIVLRGQRSIFTAYNSIMTQARELDGVDGLILIHDDVQLLDAEIATKLRASFSEPDVGVVGVIGAGGVRSLAWWEYETRGRVREDRAGVIDFGGGTHEVDMVDGLFMALSPWAVANLRFDPWIKGFHGYDADICFAAREAGARVLVTEIDMVHRTEGGYGDKGAYDRADELFQRKWGFAEEA